ncbi:MAG: helix-turn-helix domain-containing protein [Candidatus Dormibacteraceae bacterium]
MDDDRNLDEPFGLWTARDVARYLNVSKSWVYQAAESGRLPCIKLGALVRFDPAAIKTLITRDSTDANRKVVPLTPKLAR